MNLNEEMLNFRPKLRASFIQYVRHEENDFYTIKTDVSKANEKVINSSYFYIMNLFNGKNTVEEIIQTVFKKAKTIDIDTISNDVLSVLYSIIEMKGLELQNNPFINNFETKIGNNKIQLSSYNDIKNINIFCKNIENNSNFLIYKNPYIDFDFMSNFEIIYNSFRDEDFIFKIENNKVITGILVFSKLSSNKATLKFLLVDNRTTDIDLILKYCVATIIKCLENNNIGFEIYLNENEDTMKYYFHSLKFSNDVLLKNELGIGKNILRVSYNI